MDYRVFELRCELTDLMIRISSLDVSSFHEALLLHKAISSLNTASGFLDKFSLESQL